MFRVKINIYQHNIEQISNYMQKMKFNFIIEKANKYLWAFSVGIP